MGKLPDKAIQELLGLLSDCRKKKSLPLARQLHDRIRLHCLESHVVLGNHLVPVLVDCDALPDAQCVFDSLTRPNVHAWTSLISGYVACGDLHRAFLVYHNMSDSHVPPNEYTFVPLLKASINLKDVAKYHRLHTEITKYGFEKVQFIGNTLVDMYSKCGLHAEACQVFDKIASHDVVSWNALISGYIEHGFGEEALSCVKKMQLEGISPDKVTLTCSLKACADVGTTKTGELIFCELIQRGLEGDLFIASATIEMYCHYGLLQEAYQVLQKLPIRDVVCWTTLIAGNAEHGLSQEAMAYFEQMQLEGTAPGDATFVCGLKACASKGTIERGQLLFADIVKMGLENNVYIGSTTVDMYAKCGLLADAQNVFSKLPDKNAVSWNVLTSAYAEHGLAQKALRCFEVMQLQGVSPADFTFAASLKACGTVRSLETGRKMHMQVTKQGLETDQGISSTLIDMYGKCGLLIEAREVFDQLPVRDVQSWTALIAGYIEHGLEKEALVCFKQMQLSGVIPDNIILTCSLQACANLGDIEKGQLLCAEIITRGMEQNPVTGSIMVDLYAKCGLLTEALELFSKFHVQGTIPCNVILASYAEHGLGKEALSLFKQMQLEGIALDAVTFSCSLKACGIVKSLETGQGIHADIIKRGVDRDLSVGNTLVSMYGTCGFLVDAQYVLDNIHVRDAVSWNALIVGYTEHGFGEETLSCFKQMQLDSISPVAVTYACSLKACGIVSSLVKGQEIHCEIAKKGLENDTAVGNTLIDMYGHCASLVEAHEVFEKMPCKNVVSWNTLIKALGEVNEGDGAVKCFNRMQVEGVQPDAITFTCLLAACSHASLVLKGQEYFKVMREEYKIEPTAEHYVCMIDLLARSGQVDEAEGFFNNMKGLSSAGHLMSVLSACKAHGEVKLGLRCFQQLVFCNQEDASAYLLMADVYATAGRWRDAYTIEGTRRHVGARKKLASATIEVNTELHNFVVGSIQSKDSVSMVDLISYCTKDGGHIPNIDSIVSNSFGEMKEVAYDLLNRYSSLLTC